MGMYGNLMKTARNIKHSVSALTKKPALLSPVRRVGHVALTERICAMTFDDGPCLLPPTGRSDGESLTDNLINTLEKFGARGTFDVVGDTSGNYPDKPGREGTASWGGVRYDHYPDIGKDSEGGALRCGEIIDRMIKGGHAVTNHGYAHILFGKKSLVYGNRAYFNNFDEVFNDLFRLHILIKERHGYEMTLARPAHYVDAIPDGFTSYDAYAMMGYTYMAADTDGAGWLPLSDYKAEVGAMVSPMKRLLEENPDALCGQIIFQKDGFNMARRTPVADGLPLQLELLTEYGYKVVTVPELLALSPFADIEPGHALSAAARSLSERGMCVSFSDNTVRPGDICTVGELYMTVFGKDAALARVRDKRPLQRGKHPYAAAAKLAGARDITKSAIGAPLGSDILDALYTDMYDRHSGLSGAALPRGEVLAAIADAVL